jgi:DNA (cytosine-5)-methyltransferase 1
MMTKLIYGSLFSGIGGFDLGFDQAGLICAWQVERDKAARSVLKTRWPNVLKYEDVRDVGKRNLEPVDLVCGGFPCQDLSIAGRREGLAGERSGLWFEFRRIIAELKPQWVIIENVPGLLSSNGGRDMGAIVGALAELRYWWAYRVFDAQYFGVPQRRRRVFIVGCLAKGCAQEVLFERQSSPWDSPPSRKEGAELAKDVAATIRSGGKGGIPSAREDGYGLVCSFGGNFSGPISVATACNANGQRLDIESETFICNTFNGYTGRADDNIVGTLAASGAGTSRPAGQGNELDFLVPSLVGVRRLTPLEAERLQGFPDNWTAGQSDSARYRQLGNAVAVPVAAWLGQRILKI